MKKDLVTAEIIVKENKVRILRVGNVNYISLTDLAKYQNSSDPSFTVKNWLRRILLIILDYGKKFIIKILIWSNSTKLKLSMVETRLQCHQHNG